MRDGVRDVLFDRVRVFDGRAVHEDTSVLVRDGVIAEVGGVLGTEDGAERVDGRGMTLLPGLIDAHTHVFSGQLEQALVFGVTTALDMFADPAAVAELKKQATARADMADLRSAGTGATATGGHPCQLAELGAYPPFPTIDGPGEAERFVAERRAEGSDYLKVLIEPGGVLGLTMPTLDGETVSALVIAGHREGMLVLAHATDRASAQLAVDAGVDGLVHVVVDELPAPGFVDTAIARDLFVVPTLVVLEAICGHFEASSLLHDERVAPWLTPLSRMLIENAIWPASKTTRREFSVAQTMVAQLHHAGVTILAGTDADSPGAVQGASIHRELTLLVEAGLSPCQALTAATAAPAERFGLADRGRITPGLNADLLLVRGDPTANIAATRAIVGVWRRGVRLDRDAVRRAATESVPAAPRGVSHGLDSATATARWFAAERAHESARPDPIVVDRFAASLVGEVVQALADQIREGNWDNPTVAVGTRFVDDGLTEAVAASGGGIGQVVLVGAGTDTRAWRLEMPDETVVYEIDQPTLLGHKIAALADAGAPRVDRREVTADPAGDWAAVLSAAGFSVALPTVWVVHGLLARLSEAAVDTVLDQVSDLSAPGSRLLTDVPGRSLLEHPWMAPWLNKLADAGIGWSFGSDTPESLLAPRGWHTEITLLSSLATRLGRWPFPDFPRDTDKTPHHYLIHARR